MKSKFNQILFSLFIFISFSCDASDPIHHPDFRREWQAFLNKIAIDSNLMNQQNNLDYEFSLLEAFSDNMLVRHRPYLSSMDRNMECRPYNDNRIILKDGTEMSASWIRLPGNYLPFIATQAPLKQNVHLFWQMVVEHDVDQIIMLTELFETPEEELCYAYWPHHNNEKLSLENGIEIKLIEEKELLADLKEKIQIRTYNVR
jgi:protein tyrosine phosphatase